MNINLGNLKCISAREHPELMSPAVAEMISKLPGAEKIGVVEINPDLSDTTAFCTKYEVAMNQAANCVILEAKRADKTWLAACVVLGNTRADVNGLARRTLDARKVSFAPMEKAIAESKMEYGAITPIGLPETWPILVDQAVADSEYVIVGSGIRKSKLVIPGNILLSVPSARVLKDLAITTSVSKS
jgi:prolyl-tRNA editing enzyme YbaK/EbsC (Cys-tRNA(Pro) deacylase)